MTGTPILIVDDNFINLMVMRVLLAKDGYETRTATNADEALAVLKTFHPRLILLDIRLPGMGGLELARTLKGIPCTKDIPIIALTAYAGKGDAEKALRAGCQAYMTKPIDPPVMLATISSYVSEGTIRQPSDDLVCAV